MSKWWQETGVLFWSVFFSFKCYKVWQEMVKFNTKITIAQLLRLTIVSPKSKIHKIHSHRRGYLSPGYSIVLGIAAALLFISVTNSCRFWGSFVKTQARFQQTCLFSWFMHALRTYWHYGHSYTLHFFFFFFFVISTKNSKFRVGYG